MKYLCFIGFLVVCLCSALTGSAQEPIPVHQHLPVRKPVFKALPDHWSCDAQLLRQLFTAAPSSRIALRVAGPDIFTGEVTAKVHAAPGLINMNIKPAKYPNAILTLSMITNEDKSVSLSGMLVDPDASDILVLKEENGHYFFKKVPRQYLMVE